MATAAKNEDLLLSDSPGDPRRVQAILADWGLDEKTISRMLSEHNVAEALRRSARVDASGSRRGTRASRSDNSEGARLHH